MKLSGRTAFLLAALALLAVQAQAENLFKNSDMNSAARWRGDRSFQEIEGNRVLALKAHPKRTQSFSQEADTRKLHDVVLRFRYMTTDYVGRGLQLRGRRDGSSTFRNIELKADGQWHDYEWKFSEIRGERKMVFSLELLEGQGTVYFDDVVLESPE